MKKCKECGREEWGYFSVLNEDGYCLRCAIVHNEEKIKILQEQLDIAVKAYTDVMNAYNRGYNLDEAVKKFGVKK